MHPRSRADLFFFACVETGVIPDRFGQLQLLAQMADPLDVRGGLQMMEGQLINRHLLPFRWLSGIARDRGALAGGGTCIGRLDRAECAHRQG